MSLQKKKKISRVHPTRNVLFNLAIFSPLSLYIESTIIICGILFTYTRLFSIFFSKIVAILALFFFVMLFIPTFF